MKEFDIKEGDVIYFIPYTREIGIKNFYIVDQINIANEFNDEDTLSVRSFDNAKKTDVLFASDVMKVDSDMIDKFKGEINIKKAELNGQIFKLNTVGEYIHDDSKGPYIFKKRKQ